MIGYSGSLISAPFLKQQLAAGVGRDSRSRRLQRTLKAWWRDVQRQLGPVSGLRRLTEIGMLPALRTLGFAECERAEGRSRDVAVIIATSPERGCRISALVVPWGTGFERHWAEAASAAGDHRCRWCLCFNGTALRLIDSERLPGRRYLEFDLGLAFHDAPTAVALGTLLHADRFAGSDVETRSGRARQRHAESFPPLDELLERSRRYVESVGVALQGGVKDALLALLASASLPPDIGADVPRGALTEALVVVYRVLFLLFAEARQLVPTWHPIYRDSYATGTLCETALAADRLPGLWESLQASWRLSRLGCRVDDLNVSPFNGALFGASRPRWVGRRPLDDERVGRVLRALSTYGSSQGVLRVSYADLGVEELGAVYERVLDYEPVAVPAPVPAEPASRVRQVLTLRRGSVARKQSATFYTPRALTEHLVESTLTPLTSGATPDAILGLRVLDPSMGSGAFLVAACGHLARAYEQALVERGEREPDSIDDGDRIGFRKLVAQRSLFGVDSNPMAVHLARLSLWLATLAAGEPLTFLDHHLRAGDSLVGSAVEDLLRPHPFGRRSRGNIEPRLFDVTALCAAMGSAVEALSCISVEPGRALADVRRKERLFASLSGRRSTLGAWRTALDLWTAHWFWDDGPPPGAGIMADTLGAVFEGRSLLRSDQLAPWIDRAGAIAREHGFFHWPLELPDVFFGADGRPLAGAGFDAIVGNPPWDMLRSDVGDATAREGARQRLGRLGRFFRESGHYRTSTRQHRNTYQLFLERTLALVKPGGRFGMVVPWSFAIDQRAAALRRRLLTECTLGPLVTVENRRRIFPVHRSLRFLLLTGTSAGSSDRLTCRFGIDTLGGLATATSRRERGAADVTIRTAWLENVAGPSLTIPFLRSSKDVAIVDRLREAAPPLGDPAGWAVEFGRELNATEHRPYFNQRTGLPVVEGKHLAPFHVALGDARYRLPEAIAARLLPAGSHRRWRLAYRDVTGPTNVRTLIAAVLPPGTVSVHTVFCAARPMDPADRWFLCGLLNSFTADFLVRLVVGNHVTAALMRRLPVPRPDPGDPAYLEIARLAQRLSEGERQGRGPLAARLQALAARLYGLGPAEFRHVLESFPLVPCAARKAAARQFDTLEGGGGRGASLA